MDQPTKPVQFKTQVGVTRVSREAILQAMEEFDLKFRATESDSGTLYAVEEGAKRYPPKRILELATGIPRNKFYGGKPSNDVFVNLSFHVVESDNNQNAKTAEEAMQQEELLKAPIPDIDQLMVGLFSKTWVRLDDDFAKLPESQYPGVYVLAYPDEKLLGHAIKEELFGEVVTEDDIFYVGVSHAGVRKRLGSL